MPRNSSSSNSIQETYSKVVLELRDRFDRSGRHAEEYFEKLLGSKRFFRREFLQEIFNDPTKSVDTKAQLALIAAHRLPTEQNIASAISNYIFDPDDTTSNATGFDGFYRYWRSYPTVTQPQDADCVRSGVIKLDVIDAHCAKFSHWSHDEIQRRPLHQKGAPMPWEKFTDPEDVGFSFFTSARIFSLGFRRQNIRMVVTNVPGDPLNKALFNGIVLTTRKRSRNVFAAGFVMAHQTNNICSRDMHYDEFRQEIGLSVNAQTLIVHS
jgi:hypothetical protein